jgi:thioredoxin
MRALNRETFDEALREADGLVLVDFWAPWCGPCQTVTPTLERLEEQYQDEVSFFMVNVEEERELMGVFQLRSIPSVLLLKPHQDRGGAQVLDAKIGAQSSQSYQQWLDSYVYPRPSIFQRIKSLWGGSSS